MGNVTVTDEVSTPATPADGVTLYSTGSELRYIDEAGDVHVLRTNQTAIATADITDNAVTNAKLADSAVGTTEIADNAVTAVKIANANITTAKLAALAVPSANLVADPHTLLWPVSAALQGGLARWYVPAGLTAAAADGSGYNTPYTIGAANGGRLLYLSEMALIPDDVVSLALDVVIPIGRQARINLTWRTSVGGTISTTSGSYVNGTGNLTRLSLENQTIPPTAAQIALYFGLGSGSGNINVHGWIVIKGASLTPTNIANLTSGDASTIMMRLAMASFIAVDGTIAANAITTTKIIDDAVTNAKLANMTRGTVKVGGTSNEPTDLDAKTSGRILVGDGTDLKSVAVSGDATITSAGVVTVPRGAPANIVWDTFNELAVGDLWDSRPRWYAADNLSIAEADVDNPYANKQRTLILGTSGNGGGKYIWFDEAGLKNGDTVQFKALVMAASGTFLLAVRPIDATGTLIGSQANGGAVVQDGTTKIISNTYTVVDATAAGVALYFVRSAGAVDLAIYATWGSQVTTLDYPPPSHRPYAAHTYAFPMQQQEYGRGLLRNWHRKIASLALGNAEQIVMAMIGDSWFDSSIGVVNKLIPLLQTAYGDAGPGYVGFAPTTAHGLSTPNVTLSKAGTWTYSDQAATSRGPDLAHAMASETASIAITATFESAIIHYIANVGAGEFRWRIDAGTWTTVDTSDAAEAHATETISGLSAASHDLDIEWLSGSIVVLGADLRESANGVRLHRLGNSGATALDWTENDATIWSDAMAALDPDLCVILLGTNDHNNNIVPITFAGYMSTLIQRIRTEFGTNCDILLLSPGYNGLVRTHQITQFIAALHEVAATQRATMLDTFQAITPYTIDGIDGWANSSHLDDIGYRVFANEIVRLLL